MPFYIMKQKKEKFLNKNNVKETKWVHAFKYYVIFRNVEILNSFNPEIQLKDTESAIKNKLKYYIGSIKSF